MKTLKYILQLAVIAVLISACSQDNLNENPPHIPTQDKFYRNAVGFQEGLNGLYSLVRKEREGMSTSSGVGWQYLRGSIFFVGTDDITTNNTGGDLHKLLNLWGNNNSPSSKTISSIFGWLYEVVNAANTVIKRSENPDVDWVIGSVNHKGRILGEAYVFRAWAYRHLMSLFGEVPLVLTETATSNDVRTDYVRETEENIRKQMVEDLLYAAEHIPWLPYNPGSMTKGVALTYLSETYLALGEYEEAERYASVCIGTGLSGDDAVKFGPTPYRLMPDFADMFKPDNVNIGKNTESLWTLQWAKDVIGGGDNMMRYGTVTYFTNQRDVTSAPALQFNNRKIGIQGTYANGSWGWGQSAMNQRVLELYFKSSTTTAVQAITDTEWRTFKYERRGDGNIIRKFFILATTDTVVPNTVNNVTGKLWAVGDTVWITKSGSDAAKIENAMGINYVKNYNMARQNFLYPLKFATCDPGFAGATESHQSQMYLRLAETYLLRAEARFRSGNINGAVNDVNALRERAEALDATAIDFGSSEREGLDFILDERSRELLFEEHRRYTLARMGRKDYMYRRIKQYNTKDEAFAPKDCWLSIPKSVMDSNRTIVMPNNPGHDGGPTIDWDI